MRSPHTATKTQHSKKKKKERKKETSPGFSFHKIY